MIYLKKLKELGLHQSGRKLWIQAEDVVFLIDQLKAAQREAAQNKIDADCFRWWVHEAAANPILVAKAIAHCITEDEYREVICGAMEKRDAAIKAAMTNT